MKRILFVDDEPRVLEGLKRLLRPQRHEWEMAFAEGGEAALALLARDPFDVVVTDMRMPGMDGADLLEKVRELYPHMGRIVLSGHIEVQFALRTVRLAHQFLLKPCDAAALRAAIGRVCNLEGTLPNESLARAIGGMGELPSSPRLYCSLTQALVNPDCSLDQIGSIIEKDVAISAKVLQLVNSALFGLSRDISSVRDGVSYLGFNTLQNLVVTVEALRAFPISRRLSGFSIDVFEKHAETTARVTRSFSLPKEAAEVALAGGLLHDVGKLVLAACLPEQLEEALRVAEERKKPLHEVEAELYGVTHADIGAYLLGLWGLPKQITHAVAYHHSPLSLPDQGLSASAVVYLSNILAHEIDRDARPTALAAPAPPLRELGVREQYAVLQERARAAVAPGVNHAC